MLNRVTLFVVVCALFLVTDLWADGMFVCPKDEAHFVQKKREMQKIFKGCQNERSSNRVYVSTGIPGVDVTVWEGESGVDAKNLCLAGFARELDKLEQCIQAVLPGRNFLSRDEYAGVLLNRDQVAEYWQMIDGYQNETRPRAFETVIDRFDIKGEEIMFGGLSETQFVDNLNKLALSREDKDIALLYFHYLMSTYNYKFFNERNQNWYSGLGWFDQQKKNFLEKYPESRHRAFIEREMFRIYPTEQEAAEMGAEKVRQQIAKKSVWMSLSMFGLIGFPALGGFDEDNVDVSSLFSLGLKYQFRFLSAQYEYSMSFGGNSHNGIFSEKDWALMLGFSAGAYRYVTFDFLFGYAFMDVYPNKEDLPIQENYISPRVVIQSSIFFPIAESWDTFFHVQFALGMVPGSFEYYHVEHEIDPAPMGSFSVGVGFRFWKPRPVSSYPEKYTKNL